MIAISSAYKKALIAVDINGKHGFKELDANCKHSENIMPCIAEILEENNLKLTENETYAVVIGPGSFTGLRIGIALVKGMIAGNKENKSILPLTTFDLMSYSYTKNNKVEGNFTCVINALSGLFFVCDYDKNGNKITKERMIEKQELDNIQNIKVGLKEEELTNILVDPTAVDLLELATDKSKPENFCDINNLIPMYLRKSQAEASLEQKILQKN